MKELLIAQDFRDHIGQKVYYIEADQLRETIIIGEGVEGVFIFANGAKVFSEFVDAPWPEVSRKGKAGKKRHINSQRRYFAGAHDPEFTGSILAQYHLRKLRMIRATYLLNSNRGAHDIRITWNQLNAIVGLAEEQAAMLGGAEDDSERIEWLKHINKFLENNGFETVSI